YLAERASREVPRAATQRKVAPAWEGQPLIELDPFGFEDWEEEAWQALVENGTLAEILERHLPDEDKHNPYHDELGRFTSAPSAVTPMGSRENPWRSSDSPRQTSSGEFRRFEGFMDDALGEAFKVLGSSSDRWYASLT